MRQRSLYLAVACAVAVAASVAAGVRTLNGGAATETARVTLGPQECGTYSGQGCAPVAERVDTTMPRFSNPTRITNPLFPISELRSVVLLGRVDGKPFRSETTLLPQTETVMWNGRRITVALSQYMAFLGGRLDEVAIDRYAQSDDGAVWYLGEDVFDYRRGAVAITEGTWLAGRDGPAAMIMPGTPKVGDIFRPENVTGVVFEEVAVTQVDATVPGPWGPTRGALTARELHLDGSYSEKTFAPGYGEFRTGSDGDVEALALAVPQDRLEGGLPRPLRFLTVASFGILENARLDDWEAAEATVGRMRKNLPAVVALAPKPIAQRLEQDIAALDAAIAKQATPRVSQLTLDIARSTLDLHLRFQPAAHVDVERFHLWTQQLRVDAAAGDLAAVAGSVAVLEWLPERFASLLDASEQARLDEALRALRAASDARSAATAADHAARLGAMARRLAG